MKTLLMPAVALATAGLMAFGPNAIASSKTLYYVRKTAQHQDLEFHVRQTSTRSFAIPIEFGLELRCPVTGDAGLPTSCSSGSRSRCTGTARSPWI